MLPKQRDPHQILVFRSDGYLSAVAITITGCVAFHQRCAVGAVAKSTFASFMVASVNSRRNINTKQKTNKQIILIIDKLIIIEIYEHITTIKLKQFFLLK